MRRASREGSGLRALIAGIVHESSTFMVGVTGPTGLADFDEYLGEAVSREFRGTNTCVGGYLAACERAGVTAVPVLHARAEPGAAVADGAYRTLEQRLLQTTREAGPVDAVLLDLHGAGSLVSGESLDLAVLRAIRSVHPHTPLAVTLDLHANLPAEAVALADVVVGFLEYPHTDMAVRASLAADLAIGQARGLRQPVVRKLDLPMLLPPSPSVSGPAAQLRDLARAAEAEDGVLACTVFHGFPYADTPQASASVVTVAEADAGPADAVNRRIGTWLWDHRDQLRIAALAPAEAVAAARGASTRPVVIGDGSDNPGCGGVGDSTYLLSALLDSGLRACLATLHDPDTVDRAVRAGVGAVTQVELGGRHGWASGPPVRVAATVRAITDGLVVQQQMRRGKTLDFGPSVRLSVGAVDVIVSSRRRQVLDPEILLLHGVVPQRYDVVAVKSVNHFRAGFAGISQDLLVADAPGPLTRAIDLLPFTGPARLLWPMDPTATFPPVPAAATNGGPPDGADRRDTHPTQRSSPDRARADRR
jgi:microcystin degradation protein MlrC